MALRTGQGAFRSGNSSVTRGEVVGADPSGIVQKLYQVHVDFLGKLCPSLIRLCKNCRISADPIERWHYKVFSLSPPDLQTLMRLKDPSIRHFHSELSVETIYNLLSGITVYQKGYARDVWSEIRDKYL